MFNHDIFLLLKVKTWHDVEEIPDLINVNSPCREGEGQGQSQGRGEGGQESIVVESIHPGVPMDYHRYHNNTINEQVAGRNLFLQSMNRISQTFLNTGHDAILLLKM